LNTTEIKVISTTDKVIATRHSNTQHLPASRTSKIDRDSSYDEPSKDSMENNGFYLCSCSLHQPKLVSRRTWFRHQARAQVQADNSLGSLRSSSVLSNEDDLSSEMSLVHSNVDDDGRFVNSDGIHDSPMSPRSSTVSSHDQMADAMSSSPIADEVRRSSPPHNASEYDDFRDTLNDGFLRDGGFPDDDGIATPIPNKPSKSCNSD
jgi:hypothetical protein